MALVVAVGFQGLEQDEWELKLIMGTDASVQFTPNGLGYLLI